MLKKILFLVAAAAACAVLAGAPAQARQTGMTTATMKLLVGDLTDAGYTPRISKLPSGNWIVQVETDRANAATAAQVNSFATARSVGTRVLQVQFE